MSIAERKAYGEAVALIESHGMVVISKELADRQEAKIRAAEELIVHLTTHGNTAPVRLSQLIKAYERAGGDNG